MKAPGSPLVYKTAWSGTGALLIAAARTSGVAGDGLEIPVAATATEVGVLPPVFTELFTISGFGTSVRANAFLKKT